MWILRKLSAISLQGVDPTLPRSGFARSQAPRGTSLLVVEEPEAGIDNAPYARALRDAAEAALQRSKQ